MCAILLYASVNFIECLCFLNENMVKPVQKVAIFVLSFAENWNVCESR